MKRFPAMLLVLLLLLVTGCTSASTEEGAQGPLGLSTGNTVESTGFAGESTQTTSPKTDPLPTISSSADLGDATTTSVSAGSMTTQSTAALTTRNSAEEAMDKDTGVPPRTSSFKSVAEMLDWIQNDAYADCTFKQTVRQLKLEQLLIIEPDDDAFELMYIHVYRSYTYIIYGFVNEKDEIIEFHVHLPPMNLNANYLEAYITDWNRARQEQYTQYPEIRPGKDVIILGKSRKTYTRDYGQAVVRRTGMTTSIDAAFYTDVDGFEVQGNLRGSWFRSNWDNRYLSHFRFSKQDISKQ